MPGPIVVGTTQLGPLVTQTLQRVRDPGGGAHPRSTVISIYSLAQRTVNAILDLVYETVSFATTPKQQIYSLSVVAPNAIQLVDVKQDGTRSLNYVPYKSLFYWNRQWHRALSMERHEVFTQMGVDLMIVTPAAQAPTSLSLTYTKLTADLTQPPTGSNDPETNIMDIPDDSMPIVKDLVEALLQLRERKYAESANAIERFKQKLPRHKRFVQSQYA